jgi:hypothetical protein
MFRRVCLVLMLAALVWNPGRSAAQTNVAPLYALPADGTWVEYGWKATGPENQEQTGTLRISSVGRKDVQGVSHRWIEIKKEVRRGEEMRRQFRKLLVAEKAFTESQSLRGNVAEAFAQDEPGGPVSRLGAQRLDDFLDLGIEGAGTVLKEVREEEVETKLGKFPSRYVTARGKSGERVLEYHGWLSREVPFGWVKFEIREATGQGVSRTIFTAGATRSGRDATSEVDEAKAR